MITVNFYINCFSQYRKKINKKKSSGLLIRGPAFYGVRPFEVRFLRDPGLGPLNGWYRFVTILFSEITLLYPLNILYALMKFIYCHMNCYLCDQWNNLTQKNPLSSKVLNVFKYIKTKSKELKKIIKNNNIKKYFFKHFSPGLMKPDEAMKY